MVDRRTRRLRPATYAHSDAYMGASAGDEAAQCLRSAISLFVQMLIFPALYVPEGREKTSLDYLDEALQRWHRARGDKLGLLARWILTRELHPFVVLIDGWAQSHPEDPRTVHVQAVWSALSQVTRDLYTRHDHWLRLYAQSLISDARLLREVARLDMAQRYQPAVVEVDLRDLHATMAATLPA